MSESKNKINLTTPEIISESELKIKCSKNVLFSNVIITGYNIEILGIDAILKGEIVHAAWDTGATRTVINTPLVEILKLKSSGIKTYVYTGPNRYLAETYKIDIVFLPNKVSISDVLVTAFPWKGDICIGMDIISLGEFFVSNDKEGQTQAKFKMKVLMEIEPEFIYSKQELREYFMEFLIQMEWKGPNHFSHLLNSEKDIVEILEQKGLPKINDDQYDIRITKIYNRIFRKINYT